MGINSAVQMEEWEHIPFLGIVPENVPTEDELEDLLSHLDSNTV